MISLYNWVETYSHINIYLERIFSKMKYNGNGRMNRSKTEMVTEEITNST